MSHRAYAFRWDGAPLRFELPASATQPVHHLCFEIRNWTSRSAAATLKINGVVQAPGPDFRQGVEIDSDGTCTLIGWSSLCATTPQEFEIGGN